MGDTLGLICKVQVTGADVGDADGAPSYSGAWTGRWFARQRPRVVDITSCGSDSVRFNAEADSLNCSVLGPDATSGTPEFGLFVKQLVTEMTVEAGQKCTAIRRALVPSELVDDVLEAPASGLARVVVGAPGTEGVTMGALASLDQREQVLRYLKALLGVAQLVVGDPDHFRVVGADPTAAHFCRRCCAL